MMLQFNTSLKDPKIAAEMNFIIKIFSSCNDGNCSGIHDITILQMNSAKHSIYFK